METKVCVKERGRAGRGGAGEAAALECISKCFQSIQTREATRKVCLFHSERAN